MKAACIVLREACRKTVMCRYLEINVGTDSDTAFQKSLKKASDNVQQTA